ncbi:uncharacterized protein [Dermacentor albipictus]|uniref:uncharacterized protein isoform X1 n=1 Tax=Dermacentor albipictus TaxID=60249 RepID=UPI0038FCE6E9
MSTSKGHDTGQSGRSFRRRVRGAVDASLEAASSQLLCTSLQAPCEAEIDSDYSDGEPELCDSFSDLLPSSAHVSVACTPQHELDACLSPGALQRSRVLPPVMVECSVSDRKTGCLKDRLKSWAVKFNVSHRCLTALLKDLRNSSPAVLTELPRSAVSLLGTPRRIEGIVTIGNGQYYHFGLVAGLQHALRETCTIPQHLELIVNIDGLPLTKSTKAQFWPILCQLKNVESSEPFPIGVYFGHSKPANSNEFLKEFVSELSEAQEGGVFFRGRVIEVQILGVVCDAPARAFVLSVKGHSGYSSCTKCVTEGRFVNGRMCFPELNAAPRTDVSFKEHTDEDHHIGTSILENLSFDLVKQVPLDYMHLVCIGVMHKLLRLWFQGQHSFRMAAQVKDEISKRIEKLAACIPCEFNRRQGH